MCPRRAWSSMWWEARSRRRSSGRGRRGVPSCTSPGGVMLSPQQLDWRTDNQESGSRCHHYDRAPLARLHVWLVARISRRGAQISQSRVDGYRQSRTARSPGTAGTRLHCVAQASEQAMRKMRQSRCTAAGGSPRWRRRHDGCLCKLCKLLFPVG